MGLRDRSGAVGSDVRGALGVAALLTFVALLVDDGSFGLLAGGLVFLLISYAMTRVPIRYSMMALLFFVLALPNPGEGQPTPWEPPLTIVGKVLLNHLNTVDRAGILGVVPVSTMEMFFLLLFLIHLYRKTTRSKIDGDVPKTPQVLLRLAYLSIATSLFTWMTGLVRGGDFAMSLWQLNAVIYLPIVFLLFQVGIRGMRDVWALTRVFLAAAVYKCGLATYVVETIEMPLDPSTWSTKPAYGTAHADSMLFAICFVIIAGMLIERVHQRAKWLAAVMLPILILGTLENQRRLAWVQVGVVLFMLFLVSRESPLKKKLRRYVLYATPLVITYVVAGWNSAFGTLFKPVRTIRSVIEADTDASSQWRELENVNLIATFRHNPLFGTGYGHPFEEIAHLPAVDYSLELYIPHNSLLGLWAYTGLVGFVGVTLLWVAGVYFAVRTYHTTTNPKVRAAMLVSFGAVPIYLAQCWGDLGLSAWTGVFMMGVALTLAGKLWVEINQASEGEALRNVPPRPPAPFRPQIALRKSG